MQIYGLYNPLFPLKVRVIFRTFVVVSIKPDTVIRYNNNTSFLTKPYHHELRRMLRKRAASFGEYANMQMFNLCCGDLYTGFLNPA